MIKAYRKAILEKDTKSLGVTPLTMFATAWGKQQEKIDALESNRVKAMAAVSELNALIHTAENLHSKESSTAVCKLLDDLAIVLHGDG